VTVHVRVVALAAAAAAAVTIAMIAPRAALAQEGRPQVARQPARKTTGKIETNEDLQPAVLPPLPAGMTLDMIRSGDQLFHTKGGCFVCHGTEGQGMPAAGDAITNSLSYVQHDWRQIDSLITAGLPDAYTRSPIAMPPRGARSDLTEAEIQGRYPHLKGRSLRSTILDPASDGPRGSAGSPGGGALLCWDGLHSLDKDWAISGALQSLTDMGVEEADPSVDPLERQRSRLQEAGWEYGAPDFRKRTFFRAMVDGRYKLVRWFSPEEYGNPATADELYATGDVTLHDLVNDPGEMENLANPDHPKHDRALVARMLAKLHALVAREIGDDRAPFDLDLFGTREVRYTEVDVTSTRETRQRVASREETAPTSGD